MRLMITYGSKLNSDNGGNKCAQNIWKGGGKENIWTSKRRTVENKKKQGNTGILQWQAIVKFMNSLC